MTDSSGSPYRSAVVDGGASVELRLVGVTRKLVVLGGAAQSAGEWRGVRRAGDPIRNARLSTKEMCDA
jgi:hypothetical protein